jgi:hypothetical protein
MADLLFIASHQALREADDSENEKSIHLSQTRVNQIKSAENVKKAYASGRHAANGTRALRTAQQKIRRPVLEAQTRLAPKPVLHPDLGTSSAGRGAAASPSAC